MIRGIFIPWKETIVIFKERKSGSKKHPFSGASNNKSTLISRHWANIIYAEEKGCLLLSLLGKCLNFYEKTI